MTTAAKVRLGLFAVCLLALGWGFQELLLHHAPDVFMSEQEDMSFAWFVPLFSLYVLWRERKELVASLGVPSLWGVLLALPFLAVGFLGVRGVQIRFEILAFAGLLLALTMAFFGTKTARRVLFPCAFLLFCLPLATYLDVVTVHLRLLATSAAYGTLKLFGLDVIRRGTMLSSSTGSYAIDVAAPCSGLRSLFAMMAVTAGYAYFILPTWTKRAVLFALSVPIAIFGNVVRIITIAVIAATCSAEFATGFYHDYSGYVVFGTAIALMLAAGDLVGRFGRKEEGERRETRDASGGQVVRLETRDGVILALIALLFSSFMYWQALTPAPVYPEAPQVTLGELAGYTSVTQAVSEAERTVLPSDTVIRKRLYTEPNGRWHLVTAVIGGRSKSSIHRPELCLPAQGFSMSDPHDLDVGATEWRTITLGRKDAPNVRFAYTSFNQEGYATASHLKRIFRDVWDRSLDGRIDRWVMVSVYSCARTDAELAAFLSKLKKWTQSRPRPRQSAALPFAAGGSAMTSYANPIDLAYRVRPEAKMDFREGADPEIILHANRYWLFASKCGGYYVSDDLASWRHIPSADLPLEEYAPTVAEIGGVLHFSSRGGTVWRAVDLLAGKWERIPGGIPSVDSALFLDDDGRLYDYAGGTSATNRPIRVYEIDRGTFRVRAGTKPVPCFTADRERYGYEARGHNNELVSPQERRGCLEGAHLLKRRGRYYFQFAGPGTEFFTYSDTAFIGDSPKGPFVRQALNPFSFKPFGYAKGAGHGKTFADRYGNVWHVTTCTYFGVDRRIVLLPVFFDPDGEMWCDTAFADWPLAIPDRRCETPEAYHTGWMPLSDGKVAAASSNGDAAKNAADGDARTQWTAAGGAGEWLRVDFGGLAEVRAVQACFGECNAFDAWRKPDAARRWRIEATADGKTWQTVVDASAATDANDHAYRAFSAPVKATALRLVCVSLPADARFVVRDLRAFGSMAKPLPAVPTGFAVARDPKDARHATVTWSPVAGASGYLVRFGPTPEKMHLSWVVRNATELDLRCLDARQAYHWSVAAYNEAGFSAPTARISVK